jgi:hypothetical protein
MIARHIIEKLLPLSLASSAKPHPLDEAGK